MEFGVTPIPENINIPLSVWPEFSTSVPQKTGA
jgi:hypothetical protein